MHSNLKRDETLVLFNTDAYFNLDTNCWHIPIHGWIYEIEKSWFRKKLFAKVLQYKYGLSTDEDSSEIFGQRTGLLLVDNERNKSIVIKIGDLLFKLAKSEANGHFQDEVQITLEQLQTLIDSGAVLNNRITYCAALKPNDHRQFLGTSQLLNNTGISIISDIDDTVKITGVGEKKQLMDATFYQTFEPVLGMSELYQAWRQQGADFHFVSSSPWQLYSGLKDFLIDQGFPWASLYLKNIRFKDSTFFNLFKSGLETKPVQIDVLLKRYPKRHFILVGDSGEQDPEAYTLTYERYPKSIKGIYIRNVTGSHLTDERFNALTKRLPDGLLQLFTLPMEVSTKLGSL